MSLYIKGLDMPKDCFNCPFKVSNGIISGKRMEFECVANGYATLDDYQYDDKPSDCPLIEIDDSAITKPRDSNGRFSSGALDEWAYIPSLDGEIWKPIEGYEDRYKVSNMGRVRSRTKILSQGGKTYYAVFLCGISLSFKKKFTHLGESADV